MSCVLLLNACASSSNDELVRCNDNPDIHSECGERSSFEEEEEWKEGKTALPPLPLEENLRLIDAFEAKQGYDYLVDRASISSGRDGVMRYTVVVRSEAGRSNIFHEGLRCETREVRTYAYASSGGKFRASSNAEWKPTAAYGVRGYQAYLENVIMCDRAGWSWDASKAVEALDAQYTAGGVRIERNCHDLNTCDNTYIRHD